jgi:hypothetical protein
VVLAGGTIMQDLEKRSAGMWAVALALPLILFASQSVGLKVTVGTTSGMVWVLLSQRQ